MPPADGPEGSGDDAPARDASDPEVRSKLFNEFLVGLFLPAALLFCAVWAAVVLWGDHHLAGTPFATPILLADGRGAVAAGWPRFLLVVAGTAALLVPYLVVYARLLRPRLVERGFVTGRLV